MSNSPDHNDVPIHTRSTHSTIVFPIPPPPTHSDKLLLIPDRFTLMCITLRNLIDSLVFVLVLSSVVYLYFVWKGGNVSSITRYIKSIFSGKSSSGVPSVLGSRQLGGSVRKFFKFLI